MFFSFDNKETKNIDGKEIRCQLKKTSRVIYVVCTYFFTWVDIIYYSNFLKQVRNVIHII